MGLLTSLRQEQRDWPLPHLNTDPVAMTPGAQWFDAVSALIRVCGEQAVAPQVLGLDFHGYHSRRWAGRDGGVDARASGAVAQAALLPVSLPSQDYTSPWSGRRSAATR